MNDDAPEIFKPLAYDVAGFCRAVGIGKTTFYQEVKAGRLTARKLGRSTLILRADAETWASRLSPIGEKNRAGARLEAIADPSNPSLQISEKDR